MTRKILVAAISITYMMAGLSSISNALFSTLFSSRIVSLELFTLVGGILGLYAGLTMLRLSEFGRKLIVVLLSLRIAINTLIIMRALPYIENGVWFGIANRFGEVVYRAENRYAYFGFFVGWIVLALLTVVFLLQSETKKMFSLEIVKDVEPDIILEE